MTDTGNTVMIDDEVVPLGVVEDTDTTANIEDEAVPLAAGVEKETKQAWWWWLAAIFAALTGKTVYDKKSKKGIFKEKIAAGDAEKTESQKDTDK